MSTNAELLARRKAAIPAGISSATSLFAAKAKNAEIWDVDGKRYIDFAAGIAVCNTGHSHPKIVAAIKEQVDNVTHTAFQVSMYEPYIDLAEKLNDLAPIKDAKSVLFTSGSEAIENAVKIARIATGRPAIISFRGAFHGRTALALTLTGKIAPYRSGMGLGAAAVYHSPFPVPHHGISIEDAKAGLATVFKTDVEPKDVAAIIIEPVQGEGGFYAAPTEFMQYLRAVCDEHGILMICDEVQSGFGRTGKMFATEYSNIEPDLMATAKGMGGGMPISGVVGKASVMDAVGVGCLGGTYGGSPTACASSLATIKVIEDENLCERSVKIGARMVERINAMKNRNDVTPIGDVRGLGAMVAFELVTQRGTNTPDPDTTSKLTAKAQEKGLILLSCGYWANSIRLLAPLTIDEAHLEEGLDILESVLIDVAS